MYSIVSSQVMGFGSDKQMLSVHSWRYTQDCSWQAKVIQPGKLEKIERYEEKFLWVKFWCY